MTHRNLEFVCLLLISYVAFAHQMLWSESGRDVHTACLVWLQRASLETEGDWAALLVGSRNVEAESADLAFPLPQMRRGTCQGRRLRDRRRRR